MEKHGRYNQANADRDPASSLVPEPPPADPEDWEWALDRVNRMCASALVDAQVYRQKLLKGFGYPNEVFSRAQDHRALLIVLNRLAAESRPAAGRPLEETEEKNDTRVDGQ